MNRLYLFLALLLVHLLYDFHWQGAFIADNKGKYFFLLVVHALTWALLLGFVLYFTGYLSWWQIPMLYVSHLVIDNWKAKQPKTPETFNLIYVDQALHLVTIILASVL